MSVPCNLCWCSGFAQRSDSRHYVRIISLFVLFAPYERHLYAHLLWYHSCIVLSSVLDNLDPAISDIELERQRPRCPFTPRALGRRGRQPSMTITLAIPIPKPKHGGQRPRCPHATRARGRRGRRPSLLAESRDRTSDFFHTMLMVQKFRANKNVPCRRGVVPRCCLYCVSCNNGIA